MKRMLAVIAALMLGLPACGGGGGDAGSGEGTGGKETTGAPTIATISGTGVNGEVLDTVEVTGTNFAAPPEMDVYLVGNAETVALDFAVESDVKFSASLPLGIVPGDYTLEVANAVGKADAPLSLLKGEPGEPGISIEHAWFCPASGDLDVSADFEIAGQATHVWNFSDGSYFIACTTTSRYFPLADMDTAYAVAFVPANLAAIDPTLITAIAMYVNCQFTPTTGVVKYAVNGSPGVYQDVACSQTY